jgi:tRNA nucleotidyltransferase/poly(A) polymerase
LSRERVKQEIEKTMEQVKCPSRAFALWRSSGALETLVPALAKQDDIAFASADHIRLPGTSGRTERTDARRSHRIVSLFLGIPNERVRAALHDLRFSNADTRTLSQLSEYWSALFEPMSATLLRDEPPADATIRRWAATTRRTQLAGFLRVAEARWAAMRAAGIPAPSRESASSVYRRALRIAYRDPIELADLAVDGEDLQREGIAQGRALGKILRALLDWVVEDPSRNTRDQLLHEAARLARQLNGGAGGAGR